MSRSRTAWILACAAVAGACLASAPPSPAFAKDEKGDTAKDAKKAEQRKKDRDAFRQKRKDEGKLPFYDLLYAADPKAIEDTRWSQTEPDSPDEEKGFQLLASWSASLTQGGGITVQIQKFPHSSGGQPQGFKFDGKEVKTSDVQGVAVGITAERTKGISDIRKDKSVLEPKKSKVGPADLYLSFYGTDKAAQKPTRMDYYFWAGSAATYMAEVTFSDKYLDDAAILKKAEEFVGSIKPLKGAPK